MRTLYLGMQVLDVIPGNAYCTPFHSPYKGLIDWLDPGGGGGGGAIAPGHQDKGGAC